MRIVFGIMNYGTYFMCKKDFTKLCGFSSVQKCLASMRYLVHGTYPDAQEDYVCMLESTCFESIYRLCRTVMAVIGLDYLRTPNADDAA
jgi:hypothetical protein